jgi:hypothetical protein
MAKPRKPTPPSTFQDVEQNFDWLIGGARAANTAPIEEVDSESDPIEIQHRVLGDSLRAGNILEALRAAVELGMLIAEADLAPALRLRAASLVAARQRRHDRRRKWRNVVATEAIRIRADHPEWSIVRLATQIRDRLKKREAEHGEDGPDPVPPCAPFATI